MNKPKVHIKFDDEKIEEMKPVPQELPKKEKKLKKKTAKIQANETEQLTHITIAIPDSIVSNAQSSELRSYFMSQLARMFAIFKVDAVVILKDYSYMSKSSAFDSSAYIARNLQYLETPQYLRKHLFPIHADLKNVGLMNPIESKHHLKIDEVCEFREGVVVDRPTKDDSAWVEIGLKKQVQIPYAVKPGTKVTIKLDDPLSEKLTGVPVSTDEAKQANIYWGYTVKIEHKIQRLLNEHFDIRVLIESQQKESKTFEDIQNFNHEEYHNKKVLLCFSGYDSIQSFVENDEKQKIKPEQIFGAFDHVYRFNNDQFGVKNLRLEEQIFMLMQKLRSI